MHKHCPMPLNVKCKLIKEIKQHVCLSLVTKAQPGLRRGQGYVWCEFI